jgi:hypothetical protein
LRWNVIKNNALRNWWIKSDDVGDGIFILACQSRNFDLVRHVLNVASTEQTPKIFLGSRPNHILRALEIVVCNRFEKDFALKLLRLSREFLDELPEQYTFREATEFTGVYRVQVVFLTDIFKEALDRGQFSFVLEYSVLFTPDYNFKQEIWLWLNSEEENSRTNIPVALRKLAFCYEKNELWKKNKDLALILLRCLNNRRNHDLLEHISSFMYFPSLDVEALIEEKDQWSRNADNDWEDDQMFLNSDDDSDDSSSRSDDESDE